MDPLLLATILQSLAPQVVQSGAMLAGTGYSRRNREQLQELLAREQQGQWVTPEEEEMIRGSFVGPAAQAAAAGQRRAEQIGAAAYDRGGSSGAFQSELRNDAARQRTAGQQQAQAALAQARVSGRQAVKQEIEDRMANRSARTAAVAGTIGQHAAQVAGSAAMAAAVPPGFWQAARMYGLPSKYGLKPEFSAEGKVMGYIPTTPAVGASPAPVPPPTEVPPPPLNYTMGIDSQKARQYEFVLNAIAMDPMLRFYLNQKWGTMPPFDPNATPPAGNELDLLNALLEAYGYGAAVGPATAAPAPAPAPVP